MWVLPGPTGCALSAPHQRHDGHRPRRSRAGNTLAHRRDGARHLVADYSSRAGARIHGAKRDVKIGAADAGERHGDLYFAWGGRHPLRLGNAHAQSSDVLSCEHHGVPLLVGLASNAKTSYVIGIGNCPRVDKSGRDQVSPHSRSARRFGTDPCWRRRRPPTASQHHAAHALLDCTERNRNRGQLDAVCLAHVGYLMGFRNDCSAGRPVVKMGVLPRASALPAGRY